MSRETEMEKSCKQSQTVDRLAVAEEAVFIIIISDKHNLQYCSLPLSPIKQ